MRDLNHPRLWHTRLYRSRRVERLGKALYALLTGTLIAALAAGLHSLQR